MRLPSLFLHLPHILAIALSGMGMARTAEGAWNRAEFEKDVLVMEKKEGNFGLVDVTYLEKQVKRSLTVEEKQVYARLDDGPWRLYQDEFVRFEVPDDPLLKVEVLKPEQRKRIQIVGGAVGTTDKRYSVAYRMTVNGLPYGVLLVAEGDWFDEGICLCGPIALKRLVMREGTLLEFSLLPEGKVKKVQALGAKHRAVLFEWTHSVITPEAYGRIGASIRMAQPSTLTREEWIEQTRKHRPDDPTALVGWLNPGASEADVAALMGKPTRKQGDQLVFEKEERREDGDGARISVLISLKDGRLAAPLKDFEKYEELPPRPGSLAWAKKTVEKDRNTDEAPKLPPDTVRTLFAICKEQLAAKQDRHQWNQWCQVIYNLAEMEHRDESVRPLVKAHFFDVDLEQHYAAWVLHSYSEPENEEIFRKRLEIVLKDCAGPEKNRQTDPHEVWNLLHFMDIKEPASLDVLRLALKHPHDTVRSSAYGSGEALPSAEARAAARHAIETENNDHGITMATRLICDTGTVEDVEWLTAAKERYKTPELLNVWQEAITEIKGHPKK